MSKLIRVHVAHVLTDGIGDNSVQPRSEPRLRCQWLVLCRVGPPKVFSFLLFFLELQRTIFEWIGATPISHVKLWNLRIETTICKWTLPPFLDVRFRCVPSRSCNTCLDPEPRPPGYVRGASGKFGCGSESSPVSRRSKGVHKKRPMTQWPKGFKVKMWAIWKSWFSTNFQQIFNKFWGKRLVTATWNTTTRHEVRDPQTMTWSCDVGYKGTVAERCDSCTQPVTWRTFWACVVFWNKT